MRDRRRTSTDEDEERHAKHEDSRISGQNEEEEEECASEREGHTVVIEWFLTEFKGIERVATRFASRLTRLRCP